MNEVGAAIHIAPNASRILKSWGIDFEDLQAVFCNAIKVYDNTGKLIFVPVVGLRSVAFLINCY
jgi:salicylate hydroxylase